MVQPITTAMADLPRHQFFFFFPAKKIQALSLSSLLSSPDLSIFESNPRPPWPELQISTQATNTIAMAKTPWFNQ